MPGEQELRQTSDGFLARVERLHGLEERKRELPPSEMVEVAREVEALTRDILEWAKRQTALAEEVAAAGDDDMAAIAVVPPRAANVILLEWRAAERALEGGAPNTAQWESAQADVDRLREEYARAYARLRKADPSS